ncbi:MAG: glycosyl hydrolase family 18 protein [Chthoniobacter sp.]
MAHAEPPSARMVMTWVPPYGIDQCRARLREDIEGLGPKDALTHLALQFWIPTRAGGVEKTPKYGGIRDATIIEFRDWAHRHGIRALLCVYNSVDSWDWTLAQAGFADHPAEFVQALVAETERLGLDGVDIDLESGDGDFESSKEPYVAFIRDLSTRLHALHKQLTPRQLRLQMECAESNVVARPLPIRRWPQQHGLRAHRRERRTMARLRRAKSRRRPERLQAPPRRPRFQARLARQHRRRTRRLDRPRPGCRHHHLGRPFQRPLLADRRRLASPRENPPGTVSLTGRDDTPRNVRVSR